MSISFLLNLLSDNDKFDSIYPDFIQEKSKIFWTPLDIAKRAAELLVEDENTKVLDVGSGVGKFCLIGAAHTKGRFYGIEHRKHLVELCDDIVQAYGIERVKFIHKNMIFFDFSPYDAFYLFNPFYEQLSQADKLDNSIEHLERHYAIYSKYVKAQFDLLPMGTKIVTYHGYSDEIPFSYKAIKQEYDHQLILWEKSRVIDERYFLEEKLLNSCVKTLREDGFIHVNCQNVMIDPMLRYFAEKHLMSKLGSSPLLDSVIESLIVKS